MAESFFATLECELLDRRRFKTHAEARMAVFEFIEGFLQSTPSAFITWVSITYHIRASLCGGESR
jgi:hypothetical protein